MILAGFDPNLVRDVTEMLGHAFMRNAFLAGTSVALLSGFAGYFVVLRGQVFSGEALSHVAFTAALGSALLGVNLLLGMFVITIGVALGMTGLGRRPGSHDVVTGVSLAWVLGLGAQLLFIYASRGANGNAGVAILFGSILGIESGSVKLSLVVAAVSISCLVFVARPLLFSSIDPTLARVRGAAVLASTAVFSVVLAAGVAESVQVVGALLVLSLLVMPAATAQLITARPYPAMALSAALALAYTWAGLIVGYYLPYPISFLITTIAFAAYLTTARWRVVEGGRKPSSPAMNERQALPTVG